MRLGVNIDHVATLRQARGGRDPDPISAALLAELGGADGIVCHLREDRRHIQDSDLRLLRETIKTKLDLEMAATEEMVKIALATRPEMVTLVPEKRREVTTEGGLDVAGNVSAIRRIVARLFEGGIVASLFVDPEMAQIRAARKAGAPVIEIHTGRYANAGDAAVRERELQAIARSAAEARQMGLKVNAGHGLTYTNVSPIALLKSIEELNIGHSIVSRALLVGMIEAVREMNRLMAG